SAHQSPENNRSEGQQSRLHQDRKLQSRRGRVIDPRKKRTPAARPALFQPAQAVTKGRTVMQYRRSIVAFVSLAALVMSIAGAAAFDESKYPDLKGKWDRVGPPRWVQAGQTAPLTPEYQKIFEWNTADH